MIPKFPAWLISVFLLFLLQTSFSYSFSEIEVKLKIDLIQNIPELERENWKLKEFRKFRNSFKKGIFTDLDYVDQNNRTWGPIVHIRRLQYLATMFSMKEHKLYGSPKILKIINDSMAYWNFKKYQNHNWWMNEIGLPLSAYRVLLFARDHLQESSVQNLIKIAQQSLNFSGRTGQNMVWYSEIFIGLGLMTNNEALLNKGTKNLSNVIYYSSPSERDGLHPDGSFFQHGQVFYSGGYGLDFSKDLSRFVWILSGSEFQLPKSKIEILSRYILEGQLWLVRGDVLNYSSIGRYYARPNYSAKKLLMACEKMSLVETRYKGLFQDCVYAIKRKKFSGLVGNKYFWKSEFMLQQNDKFSFSVKLFSKHVLSPDTTPNSEGLLNYYISDGVNYIHQDGEEYKNIFPLLDWRRLPGTTETKVKLKPLVDQRTFGNRDFVGGLSTGKIGLSVMDFSRGKHVPSPHYRYLSKMDFKASHLQVKKSWFFFEDKIIALGAGINHKGKEKHAVWTSLNQTWSRGAVTYNNGQMKQLSNGVYEGKVNWFNHDSIGYINLWSDNQFVLQNVIQKGNWNTISKLRPSEEIKGKIFSAWIEHGKDPENAAYAYAIVPGLSAGDTAIYIKNNLCITILENTPKLQAIEDEASQSLMVAFYAGGQSVRAENLELQSKTPLLLIAREMGNGVINLFLSNPKRVKLNAELELSGEFSCDSCKYRNGKTVVKVSINDSEMTDLYSKKMILRRH